MYVSVILITIMAFACVAQDKPKPRELTSEEKLVLTRNLANAAMVANDSLREQEEIRQNYEKVVQDAQEKAKQATLAARDKAKKAEDAYKKSVKEAEQKLGCELDKDFVCKEQSK